MRPARIPKRFPYRIVRGFCSASNAKGLIKAHSWSYDAPIRGSDIMGFRVVCNRKKE